MSTDSPPARRRAAATSARRSSRCSSRARSVPARRRPRIDAAANRAAARRVSCVEERCVGPCRSPWRDARAPCRGAARAGERRAAGHRRSRAAEPPARGTLSASRAGRSLAGGRVRRAGGCAGAVHVRLEAGLPRPSERNAQQWWTGARSCEKRASGEPAARRAGPRAASLGCNALKQAASGACRARRTTRSRRRGAASADSRSLMPHWRWPADRHRSQSRRASASAAARAHRQRAPGSASARRVRRSLAAPHPARRRARVEIRAARERAASPSGVELGGGGGAATLRSRRGARRPRRQLGRAL